MDIDNALKVLDTFYTEMRAAILEAKTKDLNAAQLNKVLKVLRSKGLWTSKNDDTLDGIVKNGKTRGEAFKVLTQGNEKIRTIVEEQMTKR
jgi:hypothetical protein